MDTLDARHCKFILLDLRQVSVQNFKLIALVVAAFATTHFLNAARSSVPIKNVKAVHVPGKYPHNYLSTVAHTSQHIQNVRSHGLIG